MYRSAINRIVVENLFNKFSYDINLNNDQDVAIIIAPNGRGKTTIFNLVNFVLNPSYETFSKINSVPFDRFSLIFDNDKAINLAKFKCDIADYLKEENISIKDAKRETAGRILRYLNSGSKVAYNFSLTVEAPFGSGDKECIDFYDYLINKFSELKSLGLDVDAYDTDDDDSLSQEFRRFANIKPRFSFLFKSIKNKLAAARVNTPAMFIDAARTQKANMPQYSNIRHKPAQEPIVLAKEKIDALVAEKLRQYDEIKAQASESLAMRFFNEYKKYNEHRIDYKTFAKAWTEYNSDIDKYADLGLLAVSENDRIVFGMEEGTEDYASGYEKYSSIGAFLNVLLYANEGNTEPLKEIYNKLYLFKSIFDKRNAISNKIVLFTRDGLTIVDNSEENAGTEIPIQSLSSGEKNDFIMFYELIFNAEKHSIVMIDEPEISLHIAWQEDYLDYLIDICTENNIQAIIATDSPNIINGHFDLIVEK